MKNFVIIFCFLFSVSLFADERDFRIIRYSITKNAYAIAWGVKNKKTDFEALDVKTENEINEFIEKSFLVNYVVDIETNKILSEIKSDGTEFTIAGNRYGNHFSLNLLPVHIEGLSQDEEPLVLMENWKWSNSLKDLLIINRKDDIKLTYELDNNKFDAIVKSEIKKHLKTSEEIDLFENGAATISNLTHAFLVGAGDVTKLDLWIGKPKTAGPALYIEVSFKAKIENNLPQVEIISYQSKIE